MVFWEAYIPFAGQLSAWTLAGFASGTAYRVARTPVVALCVEFQSDVGTMHHVVRRIVVDRHTGNMASAIAELCREARDLDMSGFSPLDTDVVIAKWNTNAAYTLDFGPNKVSIT